MEKKNMFQVNSSLYNYQYGGEIRLPYTLGMLLAYLKNNETLNKCFKFEKSFVFRGKVEENIKQCKNANILLCSCYVWNWEITVHLAKEVKKINPKCTIIFGGPQVPDHSEGFFEKFPFVDIIVHGEGEIVLENIFKAYVKDKDYTNIKGIETKAFRTELQLRMNNLDIIPSPYLTNLIWDLVEKKDNMRWIASWETNRGCPYLCTFCDWGSATGTKMRVFSEDRLLREVEWFSDNKIVYIDCCDANFGIYQERDFRITQKLKEQRLSKQYPEMFRPTWAKFSSEKLIPLIKELQDGGLLRAVTLAVQSLDQTTLDIIKRENIKFNKFSELTETFRKHEIPTYTEIIRGLPGETLESFKKGLETIVDTKIGAILIYHCGIFPNAPMNEPSYSNFYKIKTIRSPIYLAHSSLADSDITEYEDITIGTSSFTLDDLKEMFLYSWLVQTFHSLGIFEHISKYYHQTHQLEFMKFYEIFLDYCREKESMFSEEYHKVVKHMNDGYAGKGWNYYDQKFGDINWPIEEHTWLRFLSEKNRLLDEIKSFLTYFESKMGFSSPHYLLNDLVRFQVFVITTNNDTQEIKNETFEFDWKSFFVEGGPLKQTSKTYYYKNSIREKDPLQWAIKTVWYGRHTKKYKVHPENLQDSISELKIINPSGS